MMVTHFIPDSVNIVSFRHHGRDEIGIARGVYARG